MDKEKDNQLKHQMALVQDVLSEAVKSPHFQAEAFDLLVSRLAKTDFGLGLIELRTKFIEPGYQESYLFTNGTLIAAQHGEKSWIHFKEIIHQFGWPEYEM